MLENSIKQEKKRLFVDMDGVLAVFRPVDQLEKLYERNYFLELPPQEEVLRAVKELIRKGDYEVYILSAVLSDSKHALEEKNMWLDLYLPEVPVERRLFPPCGTDKRQAIEGGVKPTDVLMDDYTKNLLQWDPPGSGLKLLNGINHTRGTWKGVSVSLEHIVEELSIKVQQAEQIRPIQEKCR